MLDIEEALEIGRKASETVRPVGILERADMLQEARYCVIEIFYGRGRGRGRGPGPGPGPIPHAGYIWSAVRYRLLNLVRHESYRLHVGLDYEPRQRAVGLVLRMNRFESHIVELRLEGMTYAEIGVAMGVSERRIRTAMLALRVRITEGGLDDPAPVDWLKGESNG